MRGRQGAGAAEEVRTRLQGELLHGMDRWVEAIMAFFRARDAPGGSSQSRRIQNTARKHIGMQLFACLVLPSVNFALQRVNPTKLCFLAQRGAGKG